MFSLSVCFVGESPVAKHAVRPAAGCFSHLEEISRGINKMIMTEVGIIILSGG